MKPIKTSYKLRFWGPTKRNRVASRTQTVRALRGAKSFHDFRLRLLKELGVYTGTLGAIDYLKANFCPDFGSEMWVADWPYGDMNCRLIPTADLQLL